MREAIEGLRRMYENRKRNVMDRVIDAKDMDAVRMQQAKYMIYREIVIDLEEVLTKHADNPSERVSSDTERAQQHAFHEKSQA